MEDVSLCDELKNILKAGIHFSRDEFIKDQKQESSRISSSQPLFPFDPRRNIAAPYVDFDVHSYIVVHTFQSQVFKCIEDQGLDEKVAVG